MKKVIKLISVLTLLVVFLNVRAEAATNPNAALVNQAISAFMANNDIPGIAVQLYVNGQPSSYYYGYANRDKKIPVTNKTIFEVGSISKIMTSILLAQEVDFAKVGLNDPVKKYLKNLPDSFNQVTLQSLATHTSGLPFAPPRQVTTQAQLQHYLATLKEITPGEEWQYSNFGMGMLGEALESSTQWDFNKLYTRHILNPLRMQPIGVTVPAKFKKYYAQGYDKETNPVPSSTESLFPSAGGLKVMAGDMQRFLGAAIGLPGTPSRVMWPIRMTQAAYVKYADNLQGLGWTIHPIDSDTIPDLLDASDEGGIVPMTVEGIYDKPLYDGNALIDKTGTTQGFRAYIALIPNKKTGIVILANKNVPTTAIVKTARELLFKLNKIAT